MCLRRVDGAVCMMYGLMCPCLSENVVLSAWPKDRQQHCYRSVQLHPVTIEPTLLTLAV